MELNPDPSSTWGASQTYKDEWHQKYGNVSPNASASKGEWVEFAAKNGMTEAEAEDMTRDDLVEFYGAGVVVSAPSAKNNTNPGQGAGTGPEGNVATDPAKSTATVGTTTGTASGTTPTR